MSADGGFATFLEEMRRGQTYEEFAKKLDALVAQVEALEADARQKDRTITGLQNELIKAGRYKNPDPQKQLEGVQILLTKAGEYKGRVKRVRRNGSG